MTDVAITDKALVVVDSPAGIQVLPRQCIATPISLASFRAVRSERQAVIHWEVSGSLDAAAFHVWRQESGRDRIRLSQTALRGREAYDFLDSNPPAGLADYWLQETLVDGTEV